MKVIDFSSHRAGTLVKYSAHYLKTHGGNEVLRKRIGVITDFHIEEDKKNRRLVYFPWVHFEGQHGPTMVHPANLKLFRKTALPVKYIETEVA